MKGLEHFYWTKIHAKIAHFILSIYIPHCEKKLNDRGLTPQDRYKLEMDIIEFNEAKNAWKEMMLHPELYKY